MEVKHKNTIDKMCFIQNSTEQQLSLQHAFVIKSAKLHQSDEMSNTFVNQFIVPAVK